MNKLQKIFLTIGIILLVLIPVWRFLIVPEFEKISKEYNTKFDLHHLDNTNFEIGGEWTGQMVGKAIQQEKTLRIEGDVQVIEGWFKAETLEGDLLWEVKKQYGVNRKTRENVKGYGDVDRDGYYFFPKKLEKKTYRIWIPEYYHAIDFNFKNIENIKGLEVYYFDAEIIAVKNTEGFLFLELIPDTYGASCDQTIEFWVEPISGIVINYQDAGMCYYTDKETDEKIQDMQDWGNKFNDDTIANQVRIAQNKKQQIILYEIIIPILLAVIAIALFFAAYIGRRKQ